MGGMVVEQPTHNGVSAGGPSIVAGGGWDTGGRPTSVQVTLRPKTRLWQLLARAATLGAGALGLLSALGVTVGGLDLTLCVVLASLAAPLAGFAVYAFLRASRLSRTEQPKVDTVMVPDVNRDPRNLY